MLSLIFNQEKLPRTMKRHEWREIDRWRRLTQKQLKDTAAREAAALQDAYERMATTGEGAIFISDRLEQFVRPPLMVYPEVSLTNVDIRPGHVTYI